MSTDKRRRGGRSRTALGTVVAVLLPALFLVALAAVGLVVVSAVALVAASTVVAAEMAPHASTTGG